MSGQLIGPLIDGDADGTGSGAKEVDRLTDPVPDVGIEKVKADYESPVDRNIRLVGGEFTNGVTGWGIAALRNAFNWNAVSGLPRVNADLGSIEGVGGTIGAVIKRGQGGVQAFQVWSTEGVVAMHVAGERYPFNVALFNTGARPAIAGYRRILMDNPATPPASWGVTDALLADPGVDVQFELLPAAAGQPNRWLLPDNTTTTTPEVGGPTVKAGYYLAFNGVWVPISGNGPRTIPGAGGAWSALETENVFLVEIVETVGAAAFNWFAALPRAMLGAGQANLIHVPLDSNPRANDANRVRGQRIGFSAWLGSAAADAELRLDTAGWRAGLAVGRVLGLAVGGPWVANITGAAVGGGADEVARDLARSARDDAAAANRAAQDAATAARNAGGDAASALAEAQGAAQRSRENAAAVAALQVNVTNYNAALAFLDPPAPGNTYRAIGDRAHIATLPPASGDHEVRNGWDAVYINGSTVNQPIHAVGADRIEGAAILTIEPGRGVRIQKVATGVWELIADTKDEVGTGSGLGGIPDDSITFAKILAMTAAQQAGWRFEIKAAHIGAANDLPALANYNVGDVWIIAGNPTRGANAFVDITDQSTPLDTANPFDVMLVFPGGRGVAKQWTRVGTIGGINAAVQAALDLKADDSDLDAVITRVAALEGRGSTAVESGLANVIEIPDAATSMSFGIAGRNGTPAAAQVRPNGVLAGTVFWMDYRDVKGTTFVVGAKAADFNVQLANLIDIIAAGVRSQFASAHRFRIENNDDDRNVTFSGGGKAVIRPTAGEGGATVPPGHSGLISLRTTGADQYALSVNSFRPAPDVAEAVSAALPPFFSITHVPAGLAGGRAAADYPDYIELVFSEKQTARTITGVTLSLGGSPLPLDASTPISGIDAATELRGLLQFNLTSVGNATRINLANAVTRHNAKYLSGQLTITFDAGDPHVHDFAWPVQNPAFASRGFDPKTVVSRDIPNPQSNNSVDLGFDWPADAGYLLVGVNPRGTGMLGGEQGQVIRNPRFGRYLGDNTPVTARPVGDDLSEDDESIGIDLYRGGASSVGLFRLGRTAANRATGSFQGVTASTSMPLVVMKL